MESKQHKNAAPGGREHEVSPAVTQLSIWRSEFEQREHSSSAQLRRQGSELKATEMTGICPEKKPWKSVYMFGELLPGYTAEGWPVCEHE